MADYGRLSRQGCLVPCRTLTGSRSTARSRVVWSRGRLVDAGPRPHRQLLPYPSGLEGPRVEELSSDGRVEIENRRSRVVAGPLAGELRVGVHVRDGYTNSAGC